jgi:hypothetical protein
MNMPTTAVYGALLDERADYWLPVTAEALGDSRYRFTDSLTEEKVWESRPGEIVVCHDRTFKNGAKGPVAFKRGDANRTLHRALLRSPQIRSPVRPK